MPLQKLEDIEIQGIQAEDYPCDGYLQIKLWCDSWRAGKPQNFETLAIVYPWLPMSTGSSLIVGTNTDLVKRLLAPVVSRCDPLPSLPAGGPEVSPSSIVDGEGSTAEAIETDLQEAKAVKQEKEASEPTVSEPVEQRKQSHFPFQETDL